MSRVFRGAVTVAGLIVLWQVIVLVSGAPPYLLPGPIETFTALVTRSGLIAGHALVTLSEILGGLVLGTLLGAGSAVVIAMFRPARRWLLPILVTSQAIPVFAIAPLLVLWLGYGMASKIGMATLIIYFPVASSFLDGLRRTETRWIDLAHTMTGGPRARPFAVLRHVRLPAALPAFASGLRVAAAVAPIGAVVGEWVGSGAGLGYLMLRANARVQTDLMFAALLALAALAVALYFLVDFALRKAIPWQPDTLPDLDP
ncbi:MAG: ABC transporter permease [Proteobacteria bacterium]|nr:ABC transporter permease [Pseudomonadota bacterium]MDA1059505.1 ABC transporter permease [Pseudomonadota bacterium]